LVFKGFWSWFAINMSKERIFPDDVQLEVLNQMSEGTLVSHLGIEFTAIGDDSIEATMPVDKRTIQPMGLLHGGASVALAETLGSIAASLTLDLTKQYPVGLEINTNHLKSMRSGKVTGKASPIHIGKSTQVWGIEIRNDENKKVAISRITMAILDVK
jgi:1,4-dihydroxy-2-naphthoyl-CoA hydrolase